jgi:predicted ATPase
MIVSHIKLKNWRNFRFVDIPMGRRVFLVGPNASGKSNFLDALRFLRDIAKSEGGGLQKAVNERGGISKIRCLAARKEPQIEIEVALSESQDQEPQWRYAISIMQKSRGHRQAYVLSEKVWKGNELILNRPDDGDKRDELRLNQTHLEQINANSSFRDISSFFESIYYLHLVPQVLRHPENFAGPTGDDDPFGRNFLERVVQTPEKTRKSRLKKIEQALQLAVPQLKQLADTRDERGVPHLEAVYEHWRPNAGKQGEDQFSDGTLRLIGFLWSVLEGDALLLMEEPELSLHPAIVSKIPGLIWRIQTKKKRQTIISTHSFDLLSDQGIGGEEVLLLTPDVEGTKMTLASSIKDIKVLLDSGISVAEAVTPKTEPTKIGQLSLFNG